MAKRAPSTETKFTQQQEVFCRLYTQNETLFANGTLSYAEAYGIDLDSLSQETPLDDLGAPLTKSPCQAAYDNCSASASRLLRSVKVQARVTALLNEMLRDEIVDSQLAKLILQDAKPEAKIAAVREYNKIRNRIIDRIDHTTGGEPIQRFKLHHPE